MRKLGISEYLIEQLKGIYEEEKIRVRAGETFTEESWTVKGLRQGCVFKPYTFLYIYIATIEKKLKNR